MILPMSSGQLTLRQRRFVGEYLVDLAAAKAAIRVGYAPGSAHVTASRLMRRPAIREAIQAEFEKRFGVTKATIAAELAAVAFNNVGDVVSWSDTGLHLRPSSTLQCKAVAAVRQTKSMIEVRFADRLRALEILARLLGFFEAERRPRKSADTRPVVDQISCG